MGGGGLEKARCARDDRRAHALQASYRLQLLLARERIAGDFDSVTAADVSAYLSRGGGRSPARSRATTPQRSRASRFVGGEPAARGGPTPHGTAPRVRATNDTGRVGRLAFSCSSAIGREPGSG